MNLPGFELTPRSLSNFWGQFSDPDDDAFIHAAEVAKALWLVTGDQDLLGVNQPAIGLRILTPAQAVQHP